MCSWRLWVPTPNVWIFKLWLIGNITAQPSHQSMVEHAMRCVLCVCVYVCMYVCIYVRVWVCAHEYYAFACMHVVYMNTWEACACSHISALQPTVKPAWLPAAEVDVFALLQMLTLLVIFALFGWHLDNAKAAWIRSSFHQLHLCLRDASYCTLLQVSCASEGKVSITVGQTEVICQSAGQRVGCSWYMQKLH